MYRLLRLVKIGKALLHMENLSGERVPETEAKIKNLEWCLADNISNTSVRRPKKARSSLSRVPR